MNENHILFDLIKEQSRSLDDIQKDVHNIRVDLEKVRVQLPSLIPVIVEDKVLKKERIKASAAGGGLGAIVVTILTGLWEYFKLKG